MSKFRDALLALCLLAVVPVAANAQDIEAGAKSFKKCVACHAIGDGAVNRIGPNLNDIIGRKAGTVEGFSYSPGMLKAGEDGLVWNVENLDNFITKPRDVVKSTKMGFAGLKKPEERANLIAYLKSFSAEGGEATTPEKPEDVGEKSIENAAAAQRLPAADASIADHGIFHLGREALPEEIAAWDIDVRPDGTGLPQGHGTVSEGEQIYTDNCAVCHGDFGEGRDRWPVLAGGMDSLKADRPEKTIGSYWPYLSTVYDYVRRAMPFGNARSLNDNEIYALTAYLLFLNDIVDDEDFELSDRNFTQIRLPNEQNFIADDRLQEPQYAKKGDPCMKDCKPGPVKITMRARVLDVTPDTDDESTKGAIE